MSIVLGLNAFHADSSACVVVDGRLVAAAEEERFRRIKHWAGFPSQAIAYCLKAARATLSDVDHVALNTDRSFNFWRKVAYAVGHRPDVALVIDRLRNAARRTSLEQELAAAFPGQRLRGSVHRVEHHLAHMFSSFHVAPFSEAIALSVDGFGDFSSAAWGLGENQSLRVDGRVHFPHSLGIFYQALTQFLGFPSYGDEYKVMGLAPYGEPRYLDVLRQVVLPAAEGSFALDLRFFRHHVERVPYTWSGGTPTVGRLYSPALAELLGPERAPGAALEQRHHDIARSVQAAYEEALFRLVRALHQRYRVDALVLAGGCGMNSVANGKLTLETPISRVYVQAAAGDAGGAIGAALWIAREQGASPPRGQMEHAYWGPEFSRAEIQSLLDERRSELEQAQCRTTLVEDESELCEVVASHIAEGHVVGWFQGRMEWGPRALGNRSIVCDPRRADMKDILNSKIKRRESFRPFAPSVLRESTSEWFEQDADVPFMMQVFQVREPKRPLVPAVTHVDGSGRLQTVTEQGNPRYYHLIRAFERRTRIPMVLNTSFNENEPIVCHPREALDCFLRTRMDVLVLGDHVISRSQGQERTPV